MKSLIRILACMILFLLLAQTQIVSVKPGCDHQESTHNPAAEEYLKAEILKDGSADLAEAFPEKSQRVVRGEFIVSLWKDPDLQGIPFFKIYNTTILGDIPAEGISIPFNVEFWSCEFNGRIEISRASVQSFNMDDSVVTGAVRMGRMEAAGDLALYNTTYQSAVVLFAADFGGNFFAKDSRFDGTEVDPGTTAPLELWKIHVGQTTEFTNAVIKGDAKIDSAKFDVDVLFDHVTFEKTATFSNIEVGNLADFQGTTFQDFVTVLPSLVSRSSGDDAREARGDLRFRCAEVLGCRDARKWIDTLTLDAPARPISPEAAGVKSSGPRSPTR